MRFEIYEAFLEGSSDGINSERESAGWYWRIRAANGRIVADGSEAYASRANVRRALNRLSSAFISIQHRLPIVEVES
jgi:uncharacterized protein YegP (UPF0339 family)